jgi:hypothetical protein
MVIEGHLCLFVKDERSFGSLFTHPYTFMNGLELGLGSKIAQRFFDFLVLILCASFFLGVLWE